MKKTMALLLSSAAALSLAACSSSGAASSASVSSSSVEEVNEEVNEEESEWLESVKGYWVADPECLDGEEAPEVTLWGDYAVIGEDEFTLTVSEHSDEDAILLAENPDSDKVYMIYAEKNTENLASEYTIIVYTEDSDNPFEMMYITEDEYAARDAAGYYEEEEETTYDNDELVWAGTLMFFSDIYTPDTSLSGDEWNSQMQDSASDAIMDMLDIYDLVGMDLPVYTVETACDDYFDYYNPDMERIEYNFNAFHNTLIESDYFDDMEEFGEFFELYCDTIYNYKFAD